MKNIPIKFLSLFYALSVTIFFIFARNEVPDRAAYIKFLEASYDYLFTRWNEGFFIFFFNEPIWSLINFGLSTMFDKISANNLLIIIIFFSAYIFCSSLLRLSPKNMYWLFLFIFMDPIIKNFITHIRQGFAMGIFFLRSKYKKSYF